MSEIKNTTLASTFKNLLEQCNLRPSDESDEAYSNRVKFRAKKATINDLKKVLMLTDSTVDSKLY